VGGLTPGAATVRATLKRTPLPVHIMIRPRPGNFVCSPAEFDTMIRDVLAARAARAAGVVLGLLTAGGRVDRERTGQLVARARPLAVTFHRAFDQARDLEEALEDLVAIGVHRVLTSGGAATAAEGASRLASLVATAGERIVVLAGGGVRAPNVQRLVRTTGVREVHARCDAADAGVFAALVRQIAATE
jgi:copper homeostasis protein